MEQIASYTYDQIGASQLRLCRFVEDGDHLTAVLQIFYAEGPCKNVPTYSALSYTWAIDDASPTASGSIRIGDQHLPLLDSLQPFVQALRIKGTLIDDTWWWIDSICINQNDIPERDSQVRCMKRIYQSASRVVVWLGPASDDSSDAIDFISFLLKTSRADYGVSEIRMIFKGPQWQPKWIALQNFFSRKWWTRVWTIQEFVVPVEVMFLCGDRSVGRDAVGAALWVADRCGTDFKHDKAFQHGFNRRRAHRLFRAITKDPGRKPGLSLVALAAYFSFNEATNDRDRLYGFTALAEEHHGLTINYSWSVDEVYLQFAQSFITKHGSLDIISFAALFPTSPQSSLPSWVPDWRRRVFAIVVPLMVSQSSCTHIGNLRPPSFVGQNGIKNVQPFDPLTYTAAGTKIIDCRFKDSRLYARGFIFDVVDGLAGSRNFDFVQSSKQHSSSCKGDASTALKIMMAVCRSLVLDRGDRYMQCATPESYYTDFSQMCWLAMGETSGAVTDEFKKWFAAVRSLRFHGVGFEDMLKDSMSKKDTPSTTSLNQDDFIQSSFYGRFFDIVERMHMRLMTSYDDRIGMVPERTQKGDLICILYGCSVPMVLREEGGHECFTLVGECYVDQCMNGEALAQSNGSERMICIV